VLPVARAAHPGLSEDGLLEFVIRENVQAQIDNLLTHPSVAARVRAGTLKVHGMVFDIARGTVRVLDRRTGEFRSADDLLHDASLLSAAAGAPAAGESAAR
jgi:carbonic anhydrase